MKSRDFCFWLQGFFEVQESGLALHDEPMTLNKGQLACVKRHLAMVFQHEIDLETKLPDGASDVAQAAHQTLLNQTHSGGETLFRC